MTLHELAKFARTDDATKEKLISGFKKEVTCKKNSEEKASQKYAISSSFLSRKYSM